ncbi:DNA translocase FtsK 4TM domain-containing protein [Afifella sp. IM 167]|uniref:FtsK/SpoIIIE family DNA translocase n=1 Tax=Afifella sp. IM 167 TaxID=2033586 RepID=UPI001CCF6561|nr:DNA translocase FtsK 4TM domain-containing protein [Afifella sp. IM 167]MBZ8135054.1 cell division protein FtsK [Afifella sp. IM 167]
MAFGASSEFFHSTYALRRLAARRALQLSGFVLLLAIAVMALALLTWNVADPSFSNLTDAAPKNLLGHPGAIFADLAMQFFGLAVVALLAPPAALGLSLVRMRRPRHIPRQTGLWIGGAALAALALACLPVTAGWPLPIGLGGALGDILLRLPEFLFGDPLSVGMRAALGVLSAGLAIALLVASALTRPAEIAAASAKKARRSAVEEEDEDELDTDGERAGVLSVAAGFAMHHGFSALSAISRGLKRGGKIAVRVALERSESPGGQSQNGERLEPMLGEEREEFADEEWDVEPQAPATPRVAEAAPRLKPGRRVAREAQPSLLPSAEYQYPPLHFLSEPQVRKGHDLDASALEKNARALEGVLEDFGVRGEIINVRPGPVVTLYELEPAPGIKSSRVIGLADDIARSMSAIAARVAVVPGRNVIGIELPNVRRETVYLQELLASSDFEKSRAKLALALGKTIGGEPVIADLAKMPHLLVAGTTGSGKSVSINTMILSLLYRLKPEECRLILIDPKMLELSVYDGIPHLLTPVVTDPKKAVVALKWTVREMEERYKQMSKLGVRNIDGFNQRVAAAKKKGEVIQRTVQTGFDHDTGEAIFETEELELEPIPYIVLIIDEMADLMIVAGKEIEGAVQRLAQMARAAGIHVIMATQRPSVDVITGTIKANFPTRVSFQVTSKIDSRTILGEQGAEQLLGQGDMLFMAGGGRIQRVHGPFVSDEEVEDVVAHLKDQGVPDYHDAITDEEAEGESGWDALAAGGGSDDSNDTYDQAVAVVLRDRKVSTSYIQRRLSIGYNRAASIVERMEKEGLVSPANHAGKREILVGDENAA